MENGISREEHDEFARRMEDEHKRINHRVADLEDTVRQIGELTASVERLAQSVETMAKSQNRQESRSGYVVTTLVGAILTFVLMQIGIR